MPKTFASLSASTYLAKSKHRLLTFTLHLKSSSAQTRWHQLAAVRGSPTPFVSPPQRTDCLGAISQGTMRSSLFMFLYKRVFYTEKVPTGRSKSSSLLTWSLLFYLQFCPSVCQCQCALLCTHVSRWCYILLCQWLWKWQLTEQKPSWIYTKKKQY